MGVAVETGTAVLVLVGVAEPVDVGVAGVGTAVLVLLGVAVREGVAVFGSPVGEAVREGVAVGGKGIGVWGMAVPVFRSCDSSSSEAAAIVGSSGANSKSYSSP